MSRYSDDEKRAILDESRAILERDDTEPAEISKPAPLSLEEILREPIEDNLTRWRRKAAERKQRRTQRELTLTDAVAAAETRIETKLTKFAEDQREFVLQAIGEAFAAFFEERCIGQELAPLREQVLALKKDLVEVQAKTLATSGKIIDDAIIDVPPLPLPRRGVQ
jgi:hypothetical protein